MKYITHRGNSQCKGPGARVLWPDQEPPGGLEQKSEGYAICLHCLVWYHPEVANYSPQAKSSLQPVFINKVLLAQGHAHSFTYRLWLLSFSSGRVELLWISCIKPLSVKRSQVASVSRLDP